MPAKRREKTKEARGRLAARLPSLRHAPAGAWAAAWGCRVGGVGLQRAGRWATGLVHVGLQACCRLELEGARQRRGGRGGREGRGGGEAPASVKKATKTGVEETWSSCRKSLREAVKLTMLKPATSEMTSGWCQLLPKVAASQCSAWQARDGGRSRGRGRA